MIAEMGMPRQSLFILHLGELQSVEQKSVHIFKGV
jgi:hypothetical protein